MAKARLDIHRAICAIAGRTLALSSDADIPLLHFKRAANDALDLLDYFKTNTGPSLADKASFKPHSAKLNQMALLSMCAALERFLKELAAVCVDFVGARVLDDRLDKLVVKGSTFAAHFMSQTLGDAMCESSTWLDCDEVNDRFRALLKDLDGKADFYIFPKIGNQQPTDQQWRYQTMSIVWQYRHTLAHNDGVITKSDALKLRLQIRQGIDSPRLLNPSKADILNVKRFLNETALDVNKRVAARLSDLLTDLYNRDATLFSPQEEAERLSNALGVDVTLAGCTAIAN